MTARPADSPEHVREALVRLQTASALLERVLADEVGSGTRSLWPASSLRAPSASYRSPPARLPWRRRHEPARGRLR